MRSVRRARRRVAVAKASTVTFALEHAVQQDVAAITKEAGMNLTHFMQMLVENHVIEQATKYDPPAQRLSAKRYVINQAISRAGSLEAAGKFHENDILTVVQEAEKSPEFVAKYARALGGGEAEGIGRGARSERMESGKIARAQVSGAIIATYALLRRSA